MRSLSAARQMKERGVSVEAIISELGSANLEQVAVVGIDENEELVIAYSLSNRLELVGLLESLKSKLIDEMNYEQES